MKKLIYASVFLFIRDLQRRFTEKAVLYAILGKGWQILAGMLTVPLTLACFSPELQGYFYTFKSLAGFQTLTVLGLGYVLQQFVSHEWASLRCDDHGEITGDSKALSRLASLQHFALRWYSGVAIAITFGMGSGGYIFLHHFSQKDTDLSINWGFPWFAFCFATGVNLFLSPALNVLEGCNQVKEVNRLKLIRSILERLVTWGGMVADWKLWIFFAGKVVSAVTSTLYLYVSHKQFFADVFQVSIVERISWRKELFPVQWRFALSSIAGYMSSALLIPILFAAHGSVAAGRMGITRAILQMIQGFSFIFISTKTPAMAIAAARQDFKGLNKLFFQVTRQSSVLLILGCLTFWSVLVLCSTLSLPVAGRFLSPLPAALFALALLSRHIQNVLATYVRIQRQEPFWGLHILEILLAAGFLPYLGIKYGEIGLTTGLLLIRLCAAILSFFIFRQYKKKA